VCVGGCVFCFYMIMFDFYSPYSMKIVISDPGSSEKIVAVLSAIVGLAIKRGSLVHILNAIRLLLGASKSTTVKQMKLSRGGGGSKGVTKESIASATVTPVYSDSSMLLDVSKYLNEIAEAKVVVANATGVNVQVKGRLMTFGKGDHGKLGHGKCSHKHCNDGNCTENKREPTFVEDLADRFLVKIASLSTHSVAVTETGELYTWGNGDKSRLGHGGTAKEYSPRIVTALTGKAPVKDVACGLGHTLALLANGQVYSWGNGKKLFVEYFLCSLPLNYTDYCML
jgi:hypothetical protein